jgi:hypothetical protein
LYLASELQLSDAHIYVVGRRESLLLAAAAAAAAAAAGIAAPQLTQ